MDVETPASQGQSSEQIFIQFCFHCWMEYYNNDVIFLNNIFNAVDKGGTIVIFHILQKSF